MSRTTCHITAITLVLLCLPLTGCKSILPQTMTLQRLLPPPVVRLMHVQRTCEQAQHDPSIDAIEKRFQRAHRPGLRFKVYSEGPHRGSVYLSAVSFWGLDTCEVRYQRDRHQRPKMKRILHWRNPFTP